MRVFMLLFFVLFTMSSYAQKYYPIDLSKTSFNENTIGLKYAGVELINKCPIKSYKTKIKVEVETKFKGGDVSAASGWKEESRFEKIALKFKALATTDKETDVPDLKKFLDSAMKKVDKSDNFYKQITDDINELIGKTSEKVDFTFDLANNQNIFIEIERSTNGKNEKTWLQILRTPRTVSYISHFGFTFSSNLIKEPENYFSKNSGKGAGGVDSFTVTKLNPNGKDFWKDLSLTANFLVPIKKNKNNELSTVNFAWNVGFGVSGDAKFTVYTGPAILLNDFAAFGLGFGVSNSYKLKGEYAAGQGLKENLNFDQLHTKGIRPKILLTLSLRLSKKQLQGEDIETVGAK